MGLPNREDEPAARTMTPVFEDFFSAGIGWFYCQVRMMESVAVAGRERNTFVLSLEVLRRHGFYFRKNGQGYFLCACCADMPTCWSDDRQALRKLRKSNRFCRHSVYAFFRTYFVRYWKDQEILRCLISPINRRGSLSPFIKKLRFSLLPESK